MNNRADFFRKNSPYGIIINLTNLKYSWFNRFYKEVNDDRQSFLPWKELYSFDNTIKDLNVIEKLKQFALEYKEFGTTFQIQKKDGETDYLSVWFYNDRNLPYNSKGEIKKLMNSYLNRLSTIENILETTINVYF